MECSRDATFPSCSDYFPEVKEEDLDDSRQLKNQRHDGLTIDDYTFSTQLRLPLADQFSHQSFGNLSFADLMEPSKDTTTFQLNSMDYQINADFDLPRSVYNNFPHSLVPTAAGSCAISMLNDNSYPQVTLF